MSTTFAEAFAWGDGSEPQALFDDSYEGQTWDDLRVEISEMFLGETGDLIRENAYAVLEIRRLRERASDLTVERDRARDLAARLWDENTNLRRRVYDEIHRARHALPKSEFYRGLGYQEAAGIALRGEA